MVRNKPGLTRRLVLSLVVVLVGVVAAGVAIGLHAGSPRSTPQATAAPPMNDAARSTSPRATTMVPTATSSPDAPAKPTGQPQPLGVGGHWRLIFNAGFAGDSLDRRRWNAHSGWTGQNGVTDSLGNVHVRNGHVILMLASAHSGAEIGTRKFALKVGEFAEARIRFAGRGRTIYNWPAWWLSGPDWPDGGENDVAEGFGALTANYHSPTVTIHSGPIAGDWANHFHTFGIYRSRYFARIYWDGKVVGAYNTHDDGAPETLLLTLGAGNEIKTGAAGAMTVDFVRAWVPASRS